MGFSPRKGVYAVVDVSYRGVVYIVEEMVVDRFCRPVPASLAKGTPCPNWGMGISPLFNIRGRAGICNRRGFDGAEVIYRRSASNRIRPLTSTESTVR